MPKIKLGKTAENRNLIKLRVSQPFSLCGNLLGTESLAEPPTNAL
jgi:hypothetical protein